MTYQASLMTSLTPTQANLAATVLTRAAHALNGTRHDHDPASVADVQAAIFRAAATRTNTPRAALALASATAQIWSARATLPIIGPRARHANYGAVTNSMRRVARSLTT